MGRNADCASGDGRAAAAASFGCVLCWTAMLTLRETSIFSVPREREVEPLVRADDFRRVEQLARRPPARRAEPGAHLFVRREPRESFGERPVIPRGDHDAAAALL